MEWQNFELHEEFPTGVSISGIGNNSNNSLLYPKNKDTKGRITPENYTIGQYRVRMSEIICKVARDI
jgi:hypothetical protein